VEGVRSVRLAKFQVSSEGFGSQGRPGLVLRGRRPVSTHGKAFDLRRVQDRGRGNEWVARTLDRKATLSGSEQLSRTNVQLPL